MSPNDKKITEIYSAIDNGNFSEAVRLCLKPATSTNPLAQALLSYSYACMRKHEDALTLARKVVEQFGHDETIVSTIAHTFKVCRADNDAVLMFENFLKSYPGHEQMTQDLFNAYLRMGEYKKMQLLSQKMFKSTDNQNYIFWSVSSMLLQGSDAEGSNTAMILLVAEKMLKKLFFEGNGLYKTTMPSSEELALFVEILKRQNKHVEALKLVDELLSRPKGTAISTQADFEKNGNKVKPSPLETMSLRIDLLSSILPENRNELIIQMRQLLTQFPDQWDVHRRYIQLIVDGSNIPVLSEELVQLFLFLSELQNTHRQLRGPKLALIELNLLIGNSLWQELLTKLPGNDSNQSTMGSSFILITQYIRAFSGKQCCFSDLKKYINQLSDNDICELYTWIETEITDAIENIMKLREEESARILSVQQESSNLGNKESNVSSGNAASKKSNKSKSNKNNKSKSSSDVPSLTPQQEIVAMAAANNPESMSAQDLIRSKAVIKTCCFAKLLQISFYCDYLLRSKSNLISHRPRSSDTQWQCTNRKVSTMLDLFVVCKSLCEGGVGGAREVQPSDELLLLLSSSCRQELQHVLQFNDSETQQQVNMLSWCLRWALLLQYAQENSPYAYTFKFEVLEPFRMLSLSNMAMEAYDGMGVKHVQHDSLSYLLTTSLIEGGMLTEALDIYRKIENFHSNGKRETNDMMSRCFLHNNYSKCLELQRFLTLCERSTQLALSKAESPLLHLVQVGHTIPEAIKYLEESIKSEYFWNENLMCENMDYSLLVRVDVNGKEEIEEAQRRSIAYKERIMHSRSLTQVLLSLFNGNVDVATIRDLLSKTSFHSMNSSDISNDIANMHVSNAKDDYITWDQRLWNRLPNEWKSTIDRAMSDMFEIYLLNHTDSSEDALISLISKWQNDMKSVMELLLMSDYFLFQVNSNNECIAIVKPNYIQLFSYVVQTLICWTSLLFQYRPFMNKSVMKNAAKEFVTQLDQLRLRLSQVMDIFTKPVDSSIGVKLAKITDGIADIDKCSSIFQFDDLSNTTSAEINFFKQLQTSQRTSCDFLKDSITYKYNALSESFL